MVSNETKLLFVKIQLQGEMRFCDGAEEEDILSFESEHNIKLPAKYREWLQLSDGGELFLPAGVQLYGVKHKPVIKTDREDIPGDYCVIGKLAWGDPVLIRKTDETISIFDHEAGVIETDEVFEDFAFFIDSLYDYLGIGE